MRRTIWAARQLSRAWRSRKNFIFDGPLKGRSLWFHNKRILSVCQCENPRHIFHRAFSAGNVAKVVDGEHAGGGPLVEYTRKVASGELVDGDDYQVSTIGELQRLYDELVENESACKFDRYAASEKAGRSRWLWSRFIPQSSYSPVKGLYLYGGVGTGKTMLMDLFFNQLPENWRKKRIHFHNFMLNVHSRLRVRTFYL